jgi:hypothetical protein
MRAVVPDKQHSLPDSDSPMIDWALSLFGDKKQQAPNPSSIIPELSCNSPFATWTSTILGEPFRVKGYECPAGVPVLPVA